MTEKAKRILGVPTRRRALALLLFGTVYLVYGGLLLARPLPGIAAPFDALPGVMFLIGGLLAMWSALADRPHREWLGFSGLYVVSGLWALQYFVQWIDPDELPARPWAGFLIWSLYTALVLLIAGWAEPVPKHVLAAVQAYLATESDVDRIAHGIEDREVRDEEAKRVEGET
jgi:hypothetical protein